VSKYPEDFEIFWKAWPGRWKPETDRSVKIGKYDAFLEWKHLKDEEKKEIMSVLPKVKPAGTQYLPDACRWLKRKRWHDFL